MDIPEQGLSNAEKLFTTGGVTLFYERIARTTRHIVEEFQNTKVR